MKLDIQFENEHFAILDKEAMILTTPSREGAADGRMCLGIELQRALKQQIFPMHRLDFEVSGLVIFAKNSEAHRAANEWFEHKQVFKTYRASTESQTFAHIPADIQNPRTFLAPKPKEKFLWKARLLRGKKRAYWHVSGKHSETEAIYQGLDMATGWHQWDLHPLTGRPHQLRYELSARGFPIVGDELYGSRLKFNRPGIALRAHKIDFSRAPQAASFGLPKELEVLS
jgi:23S rRNA-/tRNA-specific pseudouridylate synthase